MTCPVNYMLICQMSHYANTKKQTALFGLSPGRRSVLLITLSAITKNQNSWKKTYGSQAQKSLVSNVNRLQQYYSVLIVEQWLLLHMVDWLCLSLIALAPVPLSALCHVNHSHPTQMVIVTSPHNSHPLHQTERESGNCHCLSMLQRQQCTLLAT